MLLVIGEPVVTTFGLHLYTFLLSIDRQRFAMDLRLVEKWIEFLKLSILRDSSLVIIPQPMIILQLSFLFNFIRTFYQVPQVFTLHYLIRKDGIKSIIKQ